MICTLKLSDKREQASEQATYLEQDTLNKESGSSKPLPVRQFLRELLPVRQTV